MISLPHHSSADHDGVALQQRALRRRQQHTTSTARIALATLFGTLRTRQTTRELPRRYALHLLVALLVPMAALLSHFSLATPVSQVVTPLAPATSAGDFVVPIAPLALDVQANGDTPVADANFATIDSLRVPDANAQLLAVQPVPATVAAESANVRNGPGANYDVSTKLSTGMPLLLLAHAGEWFKAQQPDGTIVWVAAELLTLNRAAAELLPEATDIPAPPPAKVAQVAESNLNLRDGPGTNYVGMIKLDADAPLDLLARYNDWFQVRTAQGQIGWVLSQHLAMQPGVAERIEALMNIPDPNPALVGVASESNVALRGGPSTAYDKLNALKAGVQLNLLGQYQDWYKVQTSSGTTGWISNELLNVDDYIARRVPTTRNIPALPQPKPVAQPKVTTQTQPVPLPLQPAPKPKPVPAPDQPAVPAAPVIPVQPAPQPAPAPAPEPPAPIAANNVVDFAMQFRGSRYVWGAAGPKSFDCSGFVMYVYSKFGLSLPHSAAGQYNGRYGAVVSNQADLQPGDIVFFANTYARGISHVGIYIGGGNVVQALSPKQGVGVANLGGGYWQAHYYSAIRPNR